MYLTSKISMQHVALVSFSALALSWVFVPVPQEQSERVAPARMVERMRLKVFIIVREGGEI